MVESDLFFQKVDKELATFPKKHEEPEGSFFTVKVGDEVIGCIGLRKIQPEICEMKRLFVNEEYNSIRIGKELIKSCYAQVMLNLIQHLKHFSESYFLKCFRC